MIHYLVINRSHPSAPVRSALPSTKVSPTYLQQQYFQNLKQQMSSQLSSSSRPASPNITSSSSSQQRTSASSSSAITTAKLPVQATSNKAVRPANSVEETIIGSSIDIFDSFNEYDSAAFRFSIINGFFSNLFVHPNNLLHLNSNVVPVDLEADFIAAIQKKISCSRENSEKFRSSFESDLNDLKTDKVQFWNLYRELDNAANEEELSFLSTKYIQKLDQKQNEDGLNAGKVGVTADSVYSSV